VSIRRQTLVAGTVLGAALLAWIVTAARMRGMDAGPGTDLGAFGWYLGIWTTMMAAMMLPSAAPAVLLVSRVRTATATAAFAAGYLLAWTTYGLLAYGAFRAIRHAAPSFLAWDAQGPWVAGGALVAAGLYTVTPLKSGCLRRCRSPLAQIFGLRRSPLAHGLTHGATCVGCCAGLMAALFALGVMSLTWMGVVAVAVLVEKLAPRGELLARALAVALVALGLWVASAPGSVPGLTQPAPMQTQMP
jgi:predicted metal-binding membrane protein